MSIPRPPPHKPNALASLAVCDAHTPHLPHGSDVLRHPQTMEVLRARIADLEQQLKLTSAGLAAASSDVSTAPDALREFQRQLSAVQAQNNECVR